MIENFFLLSRIRSRHYYILVENVSETSSARKQDLTEIKETNFYHCLVCVLITCENESLEKRIEGLVASPKT